METQGILTFTKVLKLFGFEKVDTRNWKDKSVCYIHKEKQWFADIMDNGSWKSVWMSGNALKSCDGYPGGWVYDDPTDLLEELKAKSVALPKED